MKKILSKSADIVFAIIYQICRAFLLWYMYRNEMPGIVDVETWLFDDHVDPKINKRIDDWVNMYADE